jgi:molecular chaperone DnaK (HSP70)
MVSGQILGENAIHKESTPSALEIPSGRISSFGRLLGQFYPKAAQNPLQELRTDFASQAKAPVKKLLEEAGLTKKDVNWLIITGDREQVATLRPLIEEYFNGKKALPKSLWQGKAVPEDEAIVFGAAIRGQKLSCQDLDECVGHTVDVSTLSLGIETVGEVFTTLILWNTISPTVRRLSVSTISDNQTKIVLKILEGERIFASKKRQIATLGLVELLPRPKGVLDIRVEFTLHPNGSLELAAEEKVSGVREQIFIEEKCEHRYTWEAIGEIIRDAEDHFENDQLSRKKLVDEVKDREADRGEFGVDVVDPIVTATTKGLWRW